MSSAATMNLEIGARRERHPALDATVQVARHPIGAVFGAVIVLMVVVAIAAPWISPYNPIHASRDTFAPPSLAHPMGTDNIGRDQLSRIMWGARTSLYVGIIAVTVGVMTGSMLGLISGFFGGALDLVLQRFVDGMLALPGIVLAMALVSILGTSTTNTLLAISIVIIPSSSRVIRSAVFTVNQNVFIEAARALGASPTRIMIRHILPNVIPPILILGSSSLGGAILIEAGLSFLGLGTQPPNASWGLMLATTGREYMETAPWLAIFPGLAISVTVLAFNMLGDVLRDVLDPRLRGSR